MLAIDYFNTLKRLQPAPELHHHVFICNFGHSAEGLPFVLDGDRLIAGRNTLQHLAREEFRSQLTCRLGVSWEELTNAL